MNAQYRDKSICSVHMQRVHLGRLILCLLCSFALCIAVIPTVVVEAYAESGVVLINGVYYTIQLNGEASVGRQQTSGSSFAVDDSFTGAVEIPSTIMDAHAQSHNVTSILPYAFSDGTGAYSSAITSVNVPTSVQTIGERAFTGCKSLSSFSFEQGSNLANIGSFTFAQCTSLSEIEIPLAVKSVGEYCFYNCQSLSKISFEDEDAASPSLTFESCAFASSNGSSVLTSITLPARTVGISTKMFQNQTALEEVDILAESLTNIGALAFESCSSLKEIRIPKLTTSGSTPIGTRAFRGCDALKTVVFLSDVDYELDSSQFSSSKMLDTYHPIPLDIENIVYYGSVGSVLFPDAGNHYYCVRFYASKDSASSSDSPVSTACIRDDVKLSNIDSDMALSDKQGEVVFEGEIPELSEQGAWYYSGHSKEECLSSSLSAYMVDDMNLACAEFEGTLSYPYIAAPISLDFVVKSAKNNTLIEGTDYSLVVTDSHDNEVDHNTLVEVGEYELKAIAIDDSNYAGELSGKIAITYNPVQLTRLFGKDVNESSYAIADAANSVSQSDTVILISSTDKTHSMAVSGLAGAYEGTIVTTNAKKLSTSAKRHLRTLRPKRVFIIGTTNTLADNVLKQTKNALSSGTKVTRLYGADACSTSAALYTRTKSTGVWDQSETCIIASTKDPMNAALAGSYAYATKSPVFLVKAGKDISSQVKKAVKSGKFKTCLVLGTKSFVSAKAVSSLNKLSSCKRVPASGAYATSLAISNYAIDNGVLGCNGMALVSSKDYTSALCTSALCGKLGSVLLVADKPTGLSLTNMKLAASNRYSMFDAFVLGGTKSIAKSVTDMFSELLVK